MSFPQVMQSSILRKVVTVAWAAVGYGLASAGNGPFVGDLRFARLDNAGSAPRADYAPTIPPQTFIVYQLMVIITSALIPGVFAERMKFSGILSANNRSERRDVALDGERGTFSSRRHPGELA
jgi:Amt family ammonium transporter